MDGVPYRYLLGENGMPHIFNSRQKARDFAKVRFAHYKTSPVFKGMKPPQIVRIQISEL
jgi:hypothetical protein